MFTSPNPLVPADQESSSGSLPEGSSSFRSADEFAAVIGPHLPELVRTARRYLRAEDLAWDAVQETLLRVWVRGWLPEEPRSALRHLVAKSSLHQLRCLDRRRFHEEQVAPPEAECRDPLHAAELDERVAEVRSALEHITRDYRLVFELYEFQGLSYEQIAAQLDLPVGTVRSRLSRARAKLRERLGDLTAA